MITDPRDSIKFGVSSIMHASSLHHGSHGGATSWRELHGHITNELSAIEINPTTYTAKELKKKHRQFPMQLE